MLYSLGRVSGKTIIDKALWKVVENKKGEKIFVLKNDSLDEREMEIIKNVSRIFKRRNDELEDCLLEYCEVMEEEMDRETWDKILRVLKKELLGYSVFENFFNAPLEEISVIGLEKDVFVYYRNYGWMKTNLRFKNEEFLKSLINKFARGLGRRLSLKTPRINATLQDGSRLHAAIPPICKEICLTIRKFDGGYFTLPDLIKRKMLSIREAVLLWMAMEVDSNILIAGNTGSGKTTLLNSLCQFLHDERIIVIEETPETKILQKHKVNLISSEEQGVDMTSLIIDSLRMRPDRVVVGEIRSGEEVRAYLQTILAGQGKGSYATFHAQNLDECIQRLLSLGMKREDINAINLITIVRRLVKLRDGKKNEERRVLGVYENRGNGSFVKIKKEFKFEMKKRIKKAFGFGDKEIKKEMERREDFLSKKILEVPNYESFYKNIGEFHRKV